MKFLVDTPLSIYQVSGTAIIFSAPYTFNQNLSQWTSPQSCSRMTNTPSCKTKSRPVLFPPLACQFRWIRFPPFWTLAHGDSGTPQGSISATKRGTQTRKWLRRGGRRSYVITSKYPLNQKNLGLNILYQSNEGIHKSGEAQATGVKRKYQSKEVNNAHNSSKMRT